MGSIPITRSNLWFGSTLGSSRSLWKVENDSMIPSLTPTEARVIGCLIEKSIVTPDQYPLTLNALTNACNQKSSRNPVMNLSPGDVQHATRTLADRSLVRIDENFKSRVDKYLQTFCNTRYNEFKFEQPELALVCVLLLRGPQTPGELRTNSRRLHPFEDNSAVETSLRELQSHPVGPLVRRLPRKVGRRDSEYMHRFVDTDEADDETDTSVVAEPDLASTDATPVAARTKLDSGSGEPGRIDDLERRVAELESVVAELRSLLD